jgi:hypothetical protein
MFPPDADGYAPLTNTIWTWMNIGRAPDSLVWTSRSAVTAQDRANAVPV